MGGGGFLEHGSLAQPGWFGSESIHLVLVEYVVGFWFNSTDGVMCSDSIWLRLRWAVWKKCGDRGQQESIESIRCMAGWHAGGLAGRQVGRQARETTDWSTQE